MAQLVIDIGNTQLKAAVFESDELIEAAHHPHTEGIDWLDGLLSRHRVNSAIQSTVKPGDEPWQRRLRQEAGLIDFDRTMAFNINNHYRTPHTLGLDRLAAVMGARYINPGSGSLVIDAGTCITYDPVDAGGNYFGGSISPGLNMRYRAMHDYTAALPLLSADSDFKSWYGSDTAGAMHSGVQNGLLYEVTGFMESCTAQMGNLNIILTGGDGLFLDTALKNSIFAGCIKSEPYLVLKGLNAAILNR